MPNIGTVWGYNCRGNTASGQLGYVLNVQATQGGSARMVFAEKCRHAFTSNATDTLPAADPLNYGGVLDFHVEYIRGRNNESFSFDTHTDAYNVSAGYVDVENDYQPRAEATGAVQFRCLKASVDRVHFVSRDGSAYAVLGGSGAVDCYVGKITGQHATSIRGGMSKGLSGEYPYAKLRVGEIDVHPSYGTVGVRYTAQGQLQIDKLRYTFRPDIFVPQSTLAFTCLNFNAPSTDPLSRCDVGEITIDLSAMSDANIAINIYGLSSTNTAEHFSVGKFTIDYGTALTGAAGRFALINSSGVITNGLQVDQSEVKQNSTTALLFATKVFQSGSSGQNVRIGSGQVRGTSGTLRKFDAYSRSISSATTALYHSNSDIFLTANVLALIDQVLTSTIKSTSPSAKVTSLQTPAFDGQRWRLSCDSTSANPLVIATGQIVNVVMDLSIVAGSCIELIATGGAWVKYTLV